MHPRLVILPLLPLAAVAAACGGASSTAVPSPGPSAYCAAATALAKSATVVDALGRAPTAEGVKAAFASFTTALDNVDGVAPGDVAADTRQLRSIFDAANVKVQQAATLPDILAALGHINPSEPDTQARTDRIDAYTRRACGFAIKATPSPSGSPSA